MWSVRSSYSHGSCWLMDNIIVVVIKKCFFVYVYIGCYFIVVFLYPALITANMHVTLHKLFEKNTAPFYAVAVLISSVLVHTVTKFTPLKSATKAFIHPAELISISAGICVLLQECNCKKTFALGLFYSVCSTAILNALDLWLHFTDIIFEKILPH